MPERKPDPLPEDEVVEVLLLWACWVDVLCVVDGETIIEILLKRICEKAGEAGPKCIVEHGQPVCKKDLAREAIVESKVNLCEDKHDVLVEVITHGEGYATVAHAPVHQQ